MASSEALVSRQPPATQQECSQSQPAGVTWINSGMNTIV